MLLVRYSIQAMNMYVMIFKAPGWYDFPVFQGNRKDCQQVVDAKSMATTEIQAYFLNSTIHKKRKKRLMMSHTGYARPKNANIQYFAGLIYGAA